MSDLSSALQSILSLIAETLPEHKRLRNPYQVADNPNLLMEKGYGVTTGPGSNPKLMVSGVKIWERDITVVVTRKMYALDHDSDAKFSAELELIKDLRRVASAFDADCTVGGAVISAEYVSDQGIEFVRGENEAFLVTRALFQVRYSEDLTS